MSKGTPTQKLEAFMFVQTDFVGLTTIAKFLNCDVKAAETAVLQLSKDLEGRGIELILDSGKCKLVASSKYSEEVIKFSGNETTKLSAPMLEVLAIVTKDQPVNQQRIEEIRGVNSEQTLRNLIALELVEETKKANDPLKLNYYKTTPLLLQTIGVKSLKELQL